MPQVNIRNYGGYILDQIPYGRVGLEDFRPLMEFDGPGAEPGRAPLQWHFEGAPVTVDYAVHLQYNYRKPYGGINDANGSLFLGYVQASGGTANQAASASATAASQQTWQFPYALPQRSSQAVASTSSVQGDGGGAAVSTLTQPVQSNGNTPSTPASAASISVVSAYESMPNLDAFVKKGPYLPFSTWATAQLFVDIEGPASEYSAAKPFPYSRQELFGQQAIWNELIYWYFGGNVYTITKAIRIRQSQSAGAETLLIGFQGPGSLP